MVVYTCIIVVVLQPVEGASYSKCSSNEHDNVVYYSNGIVNGFKTTEDVKTK